jgi:hypothetical protein
MSWTMACFCGHLFCGPTRRCPRCDTPVPAEIARPHPNRGALKAPIATMPQQAAVIDRAPARRRTQ